MRKANGLFNRVCEFVNSRPPGTTYKTSELTAWCKGYENVTSHKYYNSNPFYRTLTYQTQLKYSGIVSHVKRGEWRVDLRIPDWFTISHAETVAGYDMYVKRKDSQGNRHWIGVSRTKMTKAEILAGLLAYQTEKHADAWAENSKAKQIFTAMENAFTTTYDQGYYRDPLYYASGTYAKESEANTNKAIYARMQKTEAEALAQFTTNADASAQPTVTAQKIEFADSTFFQQPDQWKYSQQLQENLMINVGYVNSALHILDQADFLDSVQHARVLNIMAQLKDLHKTIEDRIEYKGKTQNL